MIDPNCKKCLGKGWLAPVHGFEKRCSVCNFPPSREEPSVFADVVEVASIALDFVSDAVTDTFSGDGGGFSGGGSSGSFDD